MIGPDGVETTELAIVTAEDDPNVPDVQPGEPFELSYAGIEGIMVAANGRVLSRGFDSRGAV